MSWAVAVSGSRSRVLHYLEFQSEEEAREDYALMLVKYPDCECTLYCDEED